jgi:hypothetical protein
MALHDERHWDATGGLDLWSPHPNGPLQNSQYTKSQNGASNNIAIFSVLRTPHTIMTIIVIRAYLGQITPVMGKYAICAFLEGLPRVKLEII